jgi:hypothetical protein
MSRVTLTGLNNRIRKAENQMVNLEGRVTSMEQTLKRHGETLAHVDNNTTHIVAILEGAKGWAAIAKRHGPRAIAFVLGIMVSQGFIDAESAAHIRGLFPG